MLLLVFGVWSCSTAAIWIKSVDSARVHWSLLAAYRLLLAAAFLAPLFMRDLRRAAGRYTVGHLRRSLLPGVLLGAHFLTWIPGVQMTLAANASLIVNMVPVVMPLLLHAMMRERLHAGEWVGTGLATVGVAVLAGADYHFSPELFGGDLLCLASMVLFATYLALARRNRDVPGIWLYVVPLYTIAGFVSLGVSLFYTSPGAVGSARDILCIAGLAAVPTVIGHSILNYSMKHMRGQTVSLANLAQFIFAGVMAYLILSEAPAWTFYIASVLVVAGAAQALRTTPQPALRA